MNYITIKSFSYFYALVIIFNEVLNICLIFGTWCYAIFGQCLGTIMFTNVLIYWFVKLSTFIICSKGINLVSNFLMILVYFGCIPKNSQLKKVGSYIMCVSISKLSRTLPWLPFEEDGILIFIKVIRICSIFILVPHLYPLYIILYINIMTFVVKFS